MEIVPPADTQGMIFFSISNPDLNITLDRERLDNGKTKLRVNAQALSAYYASKKKRRKPITYEMRWELAESQRWKCKVCKKLLPLAAQVDHVVPLCAGGKDDISNMQMLCANCHAEKTRVERKSGAHKNRGIKGYFPPNITMKKSV